MKTKNCETVCAEIIDEFIQKELVNAQKREKVIQMLKSGMMKSWDWVALADLGEEESTNA